MLDVLIDDLEPVVLAPLPHRIIGTVDDIWVVERAERNRDHVGEVAARIVNRRTAFRAEAVGGSLPAVGGAGPFLRNAVGFHAFHRPARLRGEGAAGALLASEAMAHRHADRIAMSDGAELPAAA